MSEAAALRVAALGLRVQAGPHVVCQHLNFELRAGHVLHVRGPSGRGKSTLLATVLGLQPPAAGECLRYSRDSAAALGRRDGAVSAWRAREVGVVLQQASVFSALRVADHFALVGAAPATAQALLRQLSLAHRFDATASTLSGGEQRRLAVACALARPRAVLVLDEPTAGLDADNCARVWQAVGVQLEAGAAALIASHDPAAAHWPIVAELLIEGAP